MTRVDWQAGNVTMPLWLLVAVVGGIGWYFWWQKDQKQESTEIPVIAKQPDTKNEALPMRQSSKYRIEEETKKRWSSEYTRRGQLWSRHASWHLPTAPRLSDRISSALSTTHGLEYVRAILKKFDVDPVTGFLPSEDPLQRLPYARYHLWEDLADDLPKLLGARLGQARGPLEQLPVLPTDKLITDADLRRAHLLLCLFAHAYVWGGNTPIDTIPQGIAVPLWEVSEKLGVPPVLGHPSLVLYNWRRLDVNGDICMENLSTLNNFFDGRDESWFYLITVEIEARGAAGIVPAMLAMDAVQRYGEEMTVTGRRRSLSNSSAGNVMRKDFWGEHSLPEETSKHYTPAHRVESDDEEFNDQVIFVNEALVGELSPARVVIYITAQLHLIATAIKGMCDSLLAMREGCHPFIFYHRVRPFLSGWKHNPTMPLGVLYEGVSSTRHMFYGGSAAQSSLLPFLDIMMGIEHESPKSRDFFLAMRDYMLKPHRDFLTYLERSAASASLRSFILDMLAGIEEVQDGEQRRLLVNLREAYDSCAGYLKKFREGHMAIVAEYIIAQQRKKDGKGLEDSAGGKGTGGTELMGFLRPIRNDCADKVLKKDASLTPPVEDAVDNKAAELVSDKSANSPPIVPTDSAPGVIAKKVQAGVETAKEMEAVSPALIREVLNAAELTSAKDYYVKYEGSVEDIDLFRGAVRPPGKTENKFYNSI